MKKQLLTTALIAGLTVASVQANTPAVEMQQEVAVETASQFKVSSKVMQSRFNLSDSKVLKTVPVSNGAATMQIVQDADGFIHKRYVTKDHVIGDRLRNVKPIVKAAASTTPSYYEGFEEYKEEFGYDWIPANMTEKNLPHNVPTAEDLSNYLNFTWNTYISGGMFLPTTTDGVNEAFIHFGYDQMDNHTDPPTLKKAAMEQDEWLITPAFTPKANENLYFIAAIEQLSVYNIGEGFFDWSTGAFTKRECVNNLMVMLSTDDGKNWTEVWNYEKDFLSKKSDQDVYYSKFDYAPFSVDLTAYRGKSVKVAFRYWRVKDNMCGNSMCLDGIMVGIPESEACYVRPNGGLMTGFSQDYLAMNSSFMVLPPYVRNKWFNASGTYADTFEWEFADETNPEATVTYNDANPKVKYSPTITPAPVMTASVGGVNPSNFTWGTIPDDPTSKSFIQYGGNMVVKGPDGAPAVIGLGNFDINKRFTAAQFGEGKYCFGTGSSEMWGGTVDAIANFFSKPAAPYSLSTLWVQCQMDVDPDTEFTLIVHEVDDWGYMGDTLAVSTCYANQAAVKVISGENYYSVPFKFYDVDEFGYEVESYLDVKTAVMVEFKGFNNPSKVRFFAPFNQFENADGGENNCYAYFLIEKKNKPGTFDRRQLDASQLLMDFNSSFLFFSDAIYNWMKVDANEFVAPVEGGNKVFDVNTFYNPQPQDAEYMTWWIESADKAAMDEWITTEFAPATETENPKMTVTAKALPQGVAGRTAEFTLNTIGASAKFTVVQGDAGVNNVAASQVAARVIGNKLVVNYSEDVNAMRVFSTAGQIVGAYELPNAGQATFDASNFAKGMYMVQFDNNQVVKFIK